MPRIRSFLVILVGSVLVSCGSGDAGSGANPPPPISESEIVSGWDRSWTESETSQVSRLPGGIQKRNVSASWPGEPAAPEQAIELLLGVNDSASELLIASSPEQLPEARSRDSSFVLSLSRAPLTVPVDVTVDLSLSPHALAADEDYVVYLYGQAGGEEDLVESLFPVESSYDTTARRLSFRLEPWQFSTRPDLVDEPPYEAVITVFRVKGVEERSELEIEFAQAPSPKSGELTPRLYGADEALKGVEPKAIDVSKQVSHTAVAASGPSDICPPVSEPLILPTDWGVITSNYGLRKNIGTQSGTVKDDFHRAIDYQAEFGHPVRAMRPGTVTNVGYQVKLERDDKTGKWIRRTDKKIARRGWGCTVQVRHEDGSYAQYAHLLCTEPEDVQLTKKRPSGTVVQASTPWYEIPVDLLIEVGTKVQTGDQIAQSANTGALAFHLHVEILTKKKVFKTTTGSVVNVKLTSGDYKPCLSGRYFAKADFKSATAADFLIAGPVGTSFRANVDSRGAHCRSSNDVGAESPTDWTLRWIRVGIEETEEVVAICTRTSIDQRYRFTRLNVPVEPPVDDYDRPHAEIEFLERDQVDMILESDFFPPDGESRPQDEADHAVPREQRYFARSALYPGFRAFP